MPAPALRVLEYAFLALLYLFLLRVIRAVWAELKEPSLSTPPSTQAPLQGLEPEDVQRANGKLSRSAPTRLTFRLPDGTTKELQLGDELTIGRAPSCGLVLAADNFVSAHHARVFRVSEQYWVEDLGSTNGTLLNGRPLVGRAPLRRGDRLQVGRTPLELRR